MPVGCPLPVPSIIAASRAFPIAADTLLATAASNAESVCTRATNESPIAFTRGYAANVTDPVVFPSTDTPVVASAFSVVHTAGLASSDVGTDTPAG